MIVQTFIVVLILGIATIGDGASYSNVYVERDIVPIGYYAYGAPFSSIENLRLSEINSPPSVHGHVTPCVSPCVYPAQTVATVAPVTPTPNVLTYNAKHVPVAVAPTKQESTGYEYSYVVYDEHTGDHKAQRELSDGSVVRGEYSFLQPDGYVREVQYVADDISGFNAVVKNFLPTPVETKTKVEERKIESPSPCHETKNEALKETPEEDSGEITIKQLKKIHEILHTKHSNEESAENSKEEHHSKHKESGKEEHSKDKHHKETKESNLDSDKESEEKHEKHHKSKKESKESEEESGEESDSEESKEELKEKSHTAKKAEEKHKSKKGSKETSSEDSEESEEKDSHGKHQEVHELLKPTDETLVPYKDILRCLETAMRRNYGVPVAMRQGPSPLTYIVLNKPC